MRTTRTKAARKTNAPAHKRAIALFLVFYFQTSFKLWESSETTVTMRHKSQLESTSRSTVQSGGTAARTKILYTIKNTGQTRPMAAAAAAATIRRRRIRRQRATSKTLSSIAVVGEMMQFWL